MTLTKPPAPRSLPHHRLIAYQLALVLVQLVSQVRIANAQLRQQARKSAASAALNAAEGAVRQTLADKSRVFAIALAEVLRSMRGSRNRGRARRLCAG